MPKRRLVLITAILIAGFGGMAMARGPQNIQNTPHNLSSNSPDEFLYGQYKSDNEDEICILCHTPHGGQLTGQLWNKESPVTTYVHYNSATLSSAVASSRPANISNESLLCLTCHDGSLSMYMVTNVSNSTGGQPTNSGIPGGIMSIMDAMNQGGKIGAGRNADGTVKDVQNDLSDDHPISFSYAAVKADYIDTGRTNELKDLATAKTNGVRFFGSGENMVECSSCHDPHVDYDAFSLGTGDADYKPFLIKPNAGSALCLACHTK